MNWQYIAGFFDGEGSIFLSGRRCRLYITQTDKEVLDRVQSFSKVGYVCSITKRKAHWKDSWLYYISKQGDVLLFLQKVYPYLIVKKRIAKNVVETLKLFVKDRARMVSLKRKRVEKIRKLRLMGFSYRAIGRVVDLDWGYVRQLFLGK